MHFMLWCSDVNVCTANLHVLDTKQYLDIVVNSSVEALHIFMRLSFTFRWFTHSEINSTKTYYYSTHSLLHHKVQTSDTAFAN